MQRTHTVPAALLLLVVCAGPAAAQQIPDNIPDLPGESPADRERERFEERHRNTISRFFAAGGFGVDPLLGDGPIYQADLNVGMSLPNGDALFLSVSARELVVEREPSVLQLGTREAVGYWSIGYGLSATRLLGDTRLARRSALNLGVGMMVGGMSALMLEATPTLDVLQGTSWAVPAGIRLSHAMFDSGEIETSRTFLGVVLGLRWHFGQRERLELR